MPDVREAKIYNGILKVWEKKLKRIDMTARQREAMVKSLIRHLQVLGCDVDVEEE